MISDQKLYWNSKGTTVLSSVAIIIYAVSCIIAQSQLSSDYYINSIKCISQHMSTKNFSKNAYISKILILIDCSLKKNF